MNRSPLRQEQQYTEYTVSDGTTQSGVDSTLEQPTPEQPDFDPTSYQDVYTKMREAGLSKQEMAYVLKKMKAKKQKIEDDKRRKIEAKKTAQKKEAARTAKNLHDFSENREEGETFTASDGNEYKYTKDGWMNITPGAKPELVDKDSFHKTQLPEYYSQMKDLSKETNYSLNQDNSVTMLDPEGESQDYYKNEAGNWVYDIGFEGAGDGVVEDEELIKSLNSESEIPLVDASLVRKEEEEAIPELNAKYRQYGFEFNQSGKFDNVTVTARNGEELEIPLDQWRIFGSDDRMAAKLNEFIQANHAGKRDNVDEFMDATVVNEGQREEIELDLNSQWDDFVNVSDNYDSFDDYANEGQEESDNEEFDPYKLLEQGAVSETTSNQLSIQAGSGKAVTDAGQDRALFKDRHDTFAKTVDAFKEQKAKREYARKNKMLPNEVTGDILDTPEYKEILSGITREDVKENVLEHLRKPQEQAAIVANVNKFIDEEGGETGLDTSWTETLGMFRSDAQRDLFSKTETQYKELSGNFQKSLKQQVLIGNELESIDEETAAMGKRADVIVANLKKIQGRDFKSQEEVDKANEEMSVLQDELAGINETAKSLHSKRENLVGAYNEVLGSVEAQSEDLEKFSLYADLLDKNYTGGSLLAHGIVSGTAGLLQSAEEFSYRFNPLRAIINEDSPMWAKALTTAAIPGWGLQAAQSPEQRKAMHDGFNKWEEEWNDGVQQPSSFDEMNGIYDFGEWTASMLGNQIPQLALMYATGGMSSYLSLGMKATKAFQIGAMLVPAAGGKFREMQEEMDAYPSVDGKPLYSNAQLYSIAMTTGAVEAISEQVTFGQMAAVSGMTNGAFKLGFNNFTKKSVASVLKRTGVDMFTEGFSESLATIGENAANRFRGGEWADKPLTSIFDGVPESFVSGAMISGLIKMPAMKNFATNAFTTADANQRIGENQQRVLDLEKMIKSDIDPRLKQSYEIEKNQLILDNNNILAQEIKKVDLLSNNEKNQLIQTESDILKLRQQAEAIAVDEKMTPEKKKKEAQRLQDKVDKLNQYKESILAEYTAEEAEANYQIEKQKIQQKIDAFNERQQQEGGEGRTVEMQEQTGVEIAEATAADAAFLDAEIEGWKNRLKDLDPDSQDAIKARNELANVTNARAQIESMSTEFGYISTNKDGNSVIHINKDVNIDKNNVTTPMHEFMHHALWATIKKNPATQKAMGTALINDINNNASKVSEDFIGKVNAYEGMDMQGEEVITTLSEAIKNGDVKYNENLFTKMGDTIRRYFQNNHSDSWLGRIEFNNGRDVYNFVKDFNDSIEKGYESGAINKVIDKGAIGKLVDGKKVDAPKDQGEVYESKVYQETDQIYKDNKSRWGNDRIRKRLAAQMAYGLEGNVLGRLKNIEGITAEKADIALDFIADDKRGLTGLIDGFDPLKMINKETGKPYESVMAYLLSPTASGKSILDARLLGFLQKNPKYGNIVQSIEQEGVKEKVEKQTKIDPVDDSDTPIEREGKRMFVNSLTIPDGRIENLVEANPDIYNDALVEVQNELAEAIKNKLVPKDTEINLNEVNKRFVSKVITKNVADANVNIDGLTYKGVKKLLTEGKLKPVLQIFADLYGIPIDKLINDSDLNQEQRGSAQQMFLLNSDANVSGLPDGHTASGTATGVPRVLLNMVNPETGKTDLLYRKTAAAKKAKTGSAAGLPLQVKQKNINKTHVQENLGIHRGKPNNTARGVDGMLRAFPIQGAMLACNQAIRQNALINATNPFSVIKVIGDGKSDLYFAKVPTVTGKIISVDSNVNPIRVKQALDYLEANPQFMAYPEAGIKQLANDLNIPISEFGNIGKVVMAEASKFKIFGITLDNLKKAISKIMPSESINNWTDFFKKNPDLEPISPYDFSNKNPDKALDVQIFKTDIKSFMETLPTAVLKNTAFLYTFHNDAKGVLKMEDLKEMTSEIIKNREAGNTVDPSTDIDFSKVGVTTTLVKKIEKIANENQNNPQKANQLINKAITDAGFSQSETSKALKYLLSSFNNFINDGSAQGRNRRGKMVSTIFKMNSSFAKGLLRGGAPIIGVSIHGSTTKKSVISTTTQENVARYHGVEGKDARAFGAILTGANPGIKGAELARVQRLVDQKLQERIDNEGLEVTVEQLKEQIAAAMLYPQIKVTKGVVQPVSVEEFQRIKERHDEHMKSLIGFTTSNLKNMMDGTFDSKVDSELKDYVRVLLNKDIQETMDGLIIDGVSMKTGSVGGNIWTRLVTIPGALKDILLPGYNATARDVIAAQLAIDKVRRGELTAPVVNNIETALGDNTTYFSKNTDIVSNNVDAGNAFDKLISKHANPAQAKVAAVELVKTMENIGEINNIKNKLTQAYPLLSNDMTLDQQLETVAIVDNAIMFSRVPNQPSQGMSVLDFDDTLATTKSNIITTAPDGTKGKLNAEQYASTYQDLLAEGYTFDFSEFNKVIDGKPAPLLNKALKLAEKFGTDNMFILTARPMQAAPAIHAFLKANGLNIPIANITGLANSTADAKAVWMAEKVGEGYNDIYFADDALQNVQAVKNVLDQMDVKSKIQQAKTTYFSKVSDEFNQVLEDTKGMKKEATFSDAKARKRGQQKGKWDWFIPASAEDFKGLLYKFLGKGKKGEAQLDFFKKTLLDPFSRATRVLDGIKQRVATDLKALNKRFKGVNKTLNKTIPTGDFTYDTAVRVYNWTKAGIDIPGISKTDQANMVKAVESDPNLVAYANGLNQVAGGVYPNPGQYWTTETIATDLYNMTEGLNRKEALAEFIANRKEMFGEWKNGQLVGPNMNKIEAIYGTKFREALTDSLWRMEHGTNRTFGANRLTNQFANWVNNSVGAIMFLNMRSAVLQTLSTVNFVNWSFNNPLRAAKAVANIPQFCKDFAYIFNSDMLKSRRSGLRTSVSHAELAEAASGGGNPYKAIFAKMIKLGFTPTQIADSFAIAAGGATFYRNRIADLMKQGVSEADAQSQAWNEFQAIAEETQQSSRPDMISSQQASPLGRLILAFQNTPMQYTRLMKKAVLDLANGRGDAKTHISKIIYYGAVQNMIFSALQKGLFAIAFSGDDEDEKKVDKEIAVANSMLDSVLRGTGVTGAIVATTKNMIMKYMQESDKGWNSDEGKVVLEFLNLSPPIGSKARKLNSGLKTLKYKGEEIKDMSLFDINNPVWNSVGHFVSFSTNIPLDRAIQKTQNVLEANNSDNETWQRIALLMGWNTWDMGVKNKAVEESTQRVKAAKEIEKKNKKEEKKRLNKIQKDKENKEREAREVQCSAHIRKGKGPRCKNRTENKNGKCYAHQ